MSPFDGSLEVEFAAIRREARVPETFSDDVLAAAAAAASAGAAPIIGRPSGVDGRVDARRIPFVTIDPPGSRDLDQAFFAERTPGGYAVYYAIADVGSFVSPGDVVDAEAWSRGFTVYGPDVRLPLYPMAISEGAASLLPDGDRPAILFAFDLDSSGVARLRTVERAWVRNRVQLAYGEVSDHLRGTRDGRGVGPLDGHEWSEALPLLEEIGRRRQALALARGAVSLPISAQHVRRWEAALHGYKLAFEDPNDVEGWNAEISLMTGMAAADRMRRCGAGLLRVLDPPRPDRILALRLTAEALGVTWDQATSYAEFVSSLDPTEPLHAAVIFHASGTMRGARYVAFEGEPPQEARHAAIAAFYSHTTAPLRRLADRYVLDALCRQCAGESLEPELLDRLQRLPEVMGNAERRSREVENAVVELAEAALLSHRLGETFDALVIRVRTDRVTVQVAEPAVRAEIATSALVDDAEDPPALVGNGSAVAYGSRVVRLGEQLRVRLVVADTRRREVTFVPVRLAT